VLYFVSGTGRVEQAGVHTPQVKGHAYAVAVKKPLWGCVHYGENPAGQTLVLGFMHNLENRLQVLGTGIY